MESGGPRQEDESAIRDFLLGKTVEDDRDRIEERLLADPAFSEMVSAIEEELIDDYTAGLLFKDERDRFEGCFLVTEERRRRVQFSTTLARARVENVKRSPLRRSLKGSASNQSGDPWRSWARIAAAAVTVISVGTVLWMNRTVGNALAELRSAEEELASLQQGRETLIEEHRRQLAEVEARARTTSTVPESTPSLPAGVGPGSRPVMVVASLTPGVLRDTGSTIPSCRVSPSTLLVELQLEIAESAHSGYTAAIHDASGDEVFRVGDLRSRTTSSRTLVSMQVPSAHLPEGDYSVRLWGKTPGEAEEVDRYYLRIVVD